MSNLHYVAGLFDGEGTVSMAKPSGSNFYVPMLSLSSTDKVLCEIIHDELAGGYVYAKTSRKPEHWSQAYEWRWKGAGCLVGIVRLAPIIRCPRKQRRMAFLLERYAAATNRNGKYTAKERAVKANLHHEFFAL